MWQRARRSAEYVLARGGHDVRCENSKQRPDFCAPSCSAFAAFNLVVSAPMIAVVSFFVSLVCKGSNPATSSRFLEASVASVKDEFPDAAAPAAMVVAELQGWAMIANSTITSKNQAVGHAPAAVFRPGGGPSA